MAHGSPPDSIAPGVMRVLVLATRVPVRTGDGTPSFVLDQATALGDAAEVLILCPRVRGAPPRSSHGDATVVRFPYFPSRWERLADEAVMPQLGGNPLLWFQACAMVVAMVIAALRAHRAFRPQVIHAQWIVPSGVVARLLSLVFGTPYLVTSHGADAFMLERWPIRGLKRAVVRRSARFVAVSNDISARYGGLTLSVVQPVGVDFQLWRSLTGPRSPEPGRIVFVGRLAAKKGVHVAIRAIAQLDDAILRIIGDGPQRMELQRLVETLGLQDRVAFLGQRTRPEVAAEFRTAAVVVIPSVQGEDGDLDGTPSVLGEAIASGVPCIASDIAGLRDHIESGRTGILFPPGDVPALCRAIASLAHNPRLGKQLADSALEASLERLDLRFTSERYLDWYRSAHTSRPIRARRSMTTRGRR